MAFNISHTIKKGKIKTFKGTINLKRCKYDTFERLRIILKASDNTNTTLKSGIATDEPKESEELNLNEQLFFD